MSIVVVFVVVSLAALGTNCCSLILFYFIFEPPQSAENVFRICEKRSPNRPNQRRVSSFWLFSLTFYAIHVPLVPRFPLSSLRNCHQLVGYRCEIFWNDNWYFFPQIDMDSMRTEFLSVFQTLNFAIRLWMSFANLCDNWGLRPSLEYVQCTYICTYTNIHGLFVLLRICGKMLYSLLIPQFTWVSHIKGTLWFVWQKLLNIWNRIKFQAGSFSQMNYKSSYGYYTTHSDRGGQAPRRRGMWFAGLIPVQLTWKELKGEEG